MTKALVQLVVGISWLVLSLGVLLGLVGGWLYYGYYSMSCHPMFAKPEANCGMLSAWASDHLLIAGRIVMPYRHTLIEQRDLLVAAAASVVVLALMIQIFYRVMRRRRRRRLGAFADVPGFRPIEE